MAERVNFEDEKINEGMSNINFGRKNVLDKNIKLSDKLSGVECPFNWNLQEILEKLSNRKEFFSGLQLKLTEFDENEPKKETSEDQWYKITVQLLIVFLLKTKNDTNGALQKIKECEALINDLGKKKNDASFLDEIKPALKHIVLASKAHVVESSSEVQMLLQEIVPVVEMTNKEHAGIKGVKAEICLLMGHEGHQLSISYAEEAIKLNPKESEWWFLAGKAMGRVRRFGEKWVRDLTDQKELEYLQKAIDLKKSPSYMVILAQSYRECARAAALSTVLSVPDKKRLQPSINKMNEKSLELYKSVLKARSNCPRSMIRCAQGLLKLPIPYKDVIEAKKIIDKCLELSPNNGYIHHVAGMMYEYHTPNYATALKHLEIASDLGNYEAMMQKIQLKYTLDKTYDPYNDLKTAEKVYEQKSLQIRTHKEFGLYYLFLKRDVLSALKHFSVIIQENKGLSLKATKNNYVNIKHDINVLEILVDETRLFITDRNPTPEEKKIMKKFLSDIQLHFPELLEKPPVRNQIDNLIKSSKYSLNTKRNKF